MNFSFSGPSCARLPYSMGGAAFVGIVLDFSIFKKDIKGLFLSALIVREVADLILYQLVSSLAKETPRIQAKVYTATNLTVNMITLMVLRRLHVIGTIGTLAFSSLIAIEMTCKIANFSHYRSASS